MALASDNDESVQAAAASHQRCPQAMLVALAGDRDGWEAFSHPKPKPDGSFLGSLLYEDDLIRAAVAGNPNTPIEVLDRLADHPLQSVRTELARNPAASVAALEQLSEDHKLHQIVAGHPNCGPDTLVRLAKEGPPAVRRLVAEHPRSPPQLVRDLADSGEVSIVQKILARGDCTDEIHELLANHRIWDARAEVAAADRCPPRLLTKLAQDSAVAVREAAAGNAATPPETLRELAADPLDRIRCAVAANPSCPQAVVQRFARPDAPAEARMAAAANPNLSLDLLESLAGDQDQDVRAAVAHRCPRPLLVAMLTDPAAVVRSEAITSQFCTSEQLQHAADDTSAVVRERVARHPNCGPDTLRALLSDGSWEVRDAVRERIHSLLTC